ncbi:MAG: hypothetical protein NTW74_15255, partial [Acidobacteria bacterium]|nr:hypothetical protein [Acidobacteriota bacterium]
MRITRNYGVPPLPGKNYHRRIDYILGIGSTAKLSTRSGKRLIQWNHLHLFATQKPPQAHPHTAVSP